MRKLVALAIAGVLMLSGVALASHNFPDVPDDHTHHDNIGWAADNGVVRGFADGLFRPNANITRGQAATMFAQYDDVARPPVQDITWYALEIEESVILPDGTILDDEGDQEVEFLPGTVFVFNEDLFTDPEFDDESQIGNNIGTCTVVSAGGETEEDFFANLACEGVIAVTGQGDISWQTRLDFPEDFEGTTASINGGTGAYFGAQGEAEIVFEEEDPPTSVYNVRLRTPGDS